MKKTCACIYISDCVIKFEQFFLQNYLIYHILGALLRITIARLAIFLTFPHSSSCSSKMLRNNGIYNKSLYDMWQNLLYSQCGDHDYRFILLIKINYNVKTKLKVGCHISLLKLIWFLGVDLLIERGKKQKGILFRLVF